MFETILYRLILMVLVVNIFVYRIHYIKQLDKFFKLILVHIDISFNFLVFIIPCR